MRRLLPALLALAFAIPPVAAAEDLPGYYGGGTGGSIRIHSIALTDRQPAGVYTFGTAFPIASMDFNRGSAFSGVLYACDTNDPDTDGDNDLADESGCQSLATLSADTANGAMRARKLVYALDINTAETAGNTSRLTIKGSFDQVSAGSTAPILASDYGVAPGVQSNQASAANEAIAAAAAAGGGTVLLPDGIIYLGNTGAGGFYSGIQITQSNITLKCETDLGCELRPLFTYGGTLIAACPAFNNSSTYGGGNNCSSGAHLTNVHVSGIKFHDDDPTNHCQSYSAASGACEGDGEETHGVFMSDCDNCSMVGNWISDIGDEGLVYLNSSGGVIAENLATGTPSIRSAGGQAIEFSGMTGGVIRDNVVRDILADPNSDAGSCTTRCVNTGSAIGINTSSGANEDIIVSGNLIIDIDTQIGISVNSSSNHNSTISIVDNQIEMDNIGAFSCLQTPSPPGTPSQCSISLNGSDTNKRSDILIQGNITNAGMTTVPTSGFGPISFVDNQIDGGTPTPGRGLVVGGNPLLVEGNHIRGFRDEGIYVIGLTTDDRTESVLITNNTLLDIGCADTNSVPSAGGGAQTSGSADAHCDYDGEDVHDVITGFNTCGSDGKVIGGVTVIGNKIIGGGASQIMDEAIHFNTCARASINDNHIDYNGSTNSAIGNSGISNFAQAHDNTILGGPYYGMSTSVDGAIANGNYVEDAVSKGIFATSSAADFVAVGNTVVADAARPIESAGQRPICVHNISRSTSTNDRLFVCGEGGSDASCGADTAADGICAENQVCNTGDTDCS